MNINRLIDAGRSFIENQDDVENAILSATEAGWSGEGYVLELFDDGSYRVLWTGQIGNLYDSPDSILVGIPELNEEEYDGENGEHCFDDALEYMEEKIAGRIQELVEYLQAQES